MLHATREPSNPKRGLQVVQHIFHNLRSISFFLDQERFENRLQSNMDDDGPGGPGNINGDQDKHDQRINAGHVHSRTHKDLLTLLSQDSEAGSRQYSQVGPPEGGHADGRGSALVDAQWDVLSEGAGSSSVTKSERGLVSVPSPIELARSLGHRLKRARDRQRQGGGKTESTTWPDEHNEEVQEVLEVVLQAVRSPATSVEQEAGSILLNQDGVFDELSQVLLENRGAESDTALLILDILSSSYESCRAAVCTASFLEKVSVKLSLPPTRKNRQVRISRLEPLEIFDTA